MNTKDIVKYLNLFGSVDRRKGVQELEITIEMDRLPNNYDLLGIEIEEKDEKRIGY